MQSLLELKSGVQGFSKCSLIFGRRRYGAFNASASQFQVLSGREMVMRPFTVCRASQLIEIERLQSLSVGGILAQDLCAFAVSLVGSLVWVKIFGMFSDRDIIEKKLCRKLIHITTAPVFVISWLLYSSAPEAQYLAALVPLVNIVKIAANGVGVFKDESFVQSMSRAGSAAELLAGPLFYTMSLFVITACFWRTSLTSFLAVGILSGGDGMADIVGRRFGKHKLPYNRNKSVEGSIAMFTFGSLFVIGLVSLFGFFGIKPVGISGHLIYLSIFPISAICTFVESLPLTNKVDDNLAVPFSAIALGVFLHRFVSL